MRQILNSRFVLLLICCFGLQYTASAQAEKMSLKQALDKNLVILKNVVASGANVSSDPAIELSLVNTSCNNIVIDVDPALVFRSKVSGAPELVLAGNESFGLNAEKMQKVKMKAYLASNDGRDAIEGEKYRYYKQDETLVKLFGYLKSQHISRNLAQKAILTVADGAPLANVYDSREPNISKKLQKFLSSAIQASSREESTHKYAALKTEPQPDNSKMTVTVDMNLKANRNLNVYILDADGFVYSGYKQTEYISGNTHTIDIQLATANMHGSYTVYVRDDDNKIWSQQTIKV